MDATLAVEAPKLATLADVFSVAYRKHIPTIHVLWPSSSSDLTNLLYGRRGEAGGGQTSQSYRSDRPVRRPSFHLSLRDGSDRMVIGLHYWDEQN